MNFAWAGDLTALFGHLSPASRKRLLFLALLMPVTAVAEMVMVVAIVPFLDLLTDGASQGSFLRGALNWLDRVTPATGPSAAAAFFAFAAVVAAALRLYLSWSSLRFAADMGHQLNLEIQRRLLHQPYLFHVSTHSSRLLASLEKVDELALNFALTAIQGFSAGLIVAAVIVALLLVDTLSAVAAVALVAVLYGAAILAVRRRFRSNATFLATARDRRIQLVQENLGGIRDIIIDRSQEAHLAAFNDVDRRFLHTLAQSSFLNAAPRFLIEGVGLGIIAIAALFIAGRPGGLPAALPTLGALALGAQRLFPLANQLYSGWVALASSSPVVSECLALLKLPIVRETEPERPLTFGTAISLEGVGFHYPEQARPALRDISFSITRGSRIAIAGRSGGGKSTLADLLMGLIEPTEGQIRVDGQLLAGPTLPAWRESIGHVPQSPFLADASLADNIALGGRVRDRARIEQAARIAQLHDFIVSLPTGYGTMVGERGVKLSGGQRQRLALARAVYRQAPLLVLDEATSALDEPTEAAIMASLDDLHAGGCTIIIIAHRLSTVQRCDRIFVLDEGELVQSGSFTELFGRLTRLHAQGDL